MRGVSTLAVVRRSALVPKRDLLLFDEIYVPNLDSQLERLTGAELADALYLIDQDVMRPANVPFEAINESLFVPSRSSRKLTAVPDRLDVVRIGNYVFRLEARNFQLMSFHFRLESETLHLPKGAERFVAATISERLGPLGHCTFMIEPDSPSIRSAFDGKILMRVISAGLRSNSHDFIIDPGGRRSPYPGLVIRGGWVDEGRNTADREGFAEWSLFEAVIDALPVPGDLVSIEAVLDFKRSATERKRLDQLGRWIQRTLIEGDKSPRLMRLEMEDLIREYEAEMRALRMSFRHERVRILLALPSGLFRALVGSPNRDQLDFLTLWEHRVKLTAAEMASNGRDLAYVASARERFRLRG